jgi:AcrR family transcriptional regulator
VALGAFARDGFEGASVRQIGRDVGVSNTLLHHYFGSKQQLWEACIDYSFGAVNARVMPEVAKLMTPGDALEKVHGLIVQYVLTAAEYPEGFQIISYEGGRGGQRLDYIVEKHVKGFLDVAKVLVDGATREGLVRDVPWASLFFLVFSGGTALFGLRAFAEAVDARPSGVSEREFLERHAQATADMIMAAVLPPHPSPGGAKS